MEGIVETSSSREPIPLDGVNKSDKSDDEKNESLWGKGGKHSLWFQSKGKFQKSDHNPTNIDNPLFNLLAITLPAPQRNQHHLPPRRAAILLPATLHGTVMPQRFRALGLGLSA
jgi:hypothetical protein